MTRTRDVFSFYFSFFNKIFPFFRERRILPVKFEQQVILLAACVVTLAFEHLSYLISGQDHRAGRTILKGFPQRDRRSISNVSSCIKLENW